MSTMLGRLLGWMVCALILALLAVPRPAGSQGNPNELMVAGGETNPVLDPHAEISAFGHHYKMAVFDGLTYIDGKGEVLPALATSWSTVSPTVWEFKLRPNVKFSTGRPFTAEDVVFSLRRILDPATKSLVAGRIATVEKVEATGELAVRVTTKGPDPILPRRLAIAYVIDDGALQKAPASEPLAQFVGTGPFKVTAFQRGQRVVFDRVDTSWRGKPDMARITLIAMPEVSTRVAALRSGQVDVIVNLPADQIEPLKAGGFEVVTALTGRTCGIMMNTRHGPPLASKLVRQALNYAIDKDTIVKNILHGVGAVAQGQLVGPDGFGHNPAVKAYPYDAAKAKALLAQAGYPNGFTHKFVGSKGLFGNDFVMEQALVGMLAEVGVKADLVIEETSLWRSNNNNGLHKDLLFTCVQYFPAMDADFVLQLFKSSHAYKWYENAAFEKAFDESRVLLEPKRRLQKLHEVAQILYEDPPVAYLYQEPVTFAHGKHVLGVQARPDQVLWFDPIKKKR